MRSCRSDDSYGYARTRDDDSADVASHLIFPARSAAYLASVFFPLTIGVVVTVACARGPCVHVRMRRPSGLIRQWSSSKTRGAVSSRRLPSRLVSDFRIAKHLGPTTVGSVKGESRGWSSDLRSIALGITSNRKCKGSTSTEAFQEVTV